MYTLKQSSDALAAKSKEGSDYALSAEAVLRKIVICFHATGKSYCFQSFLIWQVTLAACTCFSNSCRANLHAQGSEKLL